MEESRHRIIFAGLIIPENASKLPDLPRHLYHFSASGFHLWTSTQLNDFPYVSGHLNAKDATSIVQKIVLKQSFIENGKWCLVQYDSDQKSVIIARDVLGISPLYYQQNEGIFSFSNNLKLLRQLSTHSWKINPIMARSFLLHGKIDHSHSTLFENVHEVLPGEAIQICLQSADIERHKYFDYRLYTGQLTRDFDKTVTLNRQSVLNYMANWRQNETNNTVLLSGGVDSSVIAHGLCICGLKNVRLLTAVYPGQPMDESRWADIVVSSLPNFSRDFVHPTGEGFVNDIEEMHKVIDFPTLSTGTYNQYVLLKRAANDIDTKVWDGLGADALYGGHDYYRHLLFFEYSRSLKWTKALLLLLWKGDVFEELWRSLKTKVRSSGPLHHLVKHILSSDMKIYNREFIERKPPLPVNSSFANVQEMMRSEYFDHGVRHLSRFSDRIARHFGVDIIYPFAENIQLALVISQLHPNLKFHQGVSKAILRESFKAELPQPIYERKAKMGMRSPNNQWINDYASLWKSYLLEYGMGYFDLDYIDQHFERIWCRPSDPENYRLFKHISFVIWRKVHDV